MKNYYEAHVTMEELYGSFNQQIAEKITRERNWKFSMIAGDINLGDGVKLYATRQYNARLGDERVVGYLNEMADILSANGVKVVRRKVERVIYDDRSSLVQPCTGGCIECHLDDLPAPAV